MTTNTAATSITIVKVPPQNFGMVQNGTTISVPFEAIFEEANSSVAHFEITFNTTAWTYKGFDAQIGVININYQFDETVENGFLNLTATDINPASGVLNVTINFIAQTVEGNYTFAWRYDYFASSTPPPPPTPPPLPVRKSDTGATNVPIAPEFPSALILPILIILTLMTTILSKKRKPKTDFHVS